MKWILLIGPRLAYGRFLQAAYGLQIPARGPQVNVEDYDVNGLTDGQPVRYRCIPSNQLMLTISAEARLSIKRTIQKNCVACLVFLEPQSGRPAYPPITTVESLFPLSKELITVAQMNSSASSYTLTPELAQNLAQTVETNYSLDGYEKCMREAIEAESQLELVNFRNQFQRGFEQVQAQAIQRKQYEKNPFLFLENVTTLINSELMQDYTYPAELLKNRSIDCHTQRKALLFYNFLSDFLHKKIRPMNLAAHPDTHSVYHYGIYLSDANAYELNHQAEETRAQLVSALGSASVAGFPLGEVIDTLGRRLRYKTFEDGPKPIVAIQRAFRARKVKPASFATPERRVALGQLDQALAESVTPNQAFLLSTHAVITPAAAYAYFIGPVCRTRATNPVQVLDYQHGESPYVSEVYNAIDPNYLTRIAPRYWADASRRCFDSMLAYYTLQDAATNSSLTTKLQRLFKVLAPNYKGKIPLAELGVRTLSLETGVHRTFITLNNAIFNARELLGESSPLFQLLWLCLLIWAVGAYSDIFYEIYEKKVEPPEIKGRTNYKDVSITSVVHSSNRLGNFKYDDFMPPIIAPYFSLRTARVRAADYSEPIFAGAKNISPGFAPALEDQLRGFTAKFQESFYANTLLSQGGISGLSMCLLGALYEMNAVSCCVGDETTILIVLFSALVYGSGGHNFLELIQVLQMTEIKETILATYGDNSAHANFHQAIAGENLFKAFKSARLVDALSVAREYEKERRQALRQ